MELIDKSRPINSVLRIVEKHPYHWNNSLTVIKVLEGGVKVRVWARDHYLNEGDFVILNVKQIHQIEKLDDMDNLLSITRFSIDYCKSIIEDFEDVRFICSSAMYEELHQEKYKKLRSILNRLLISLKEGTMFSEDSMQHQYSKDLLLYLNDNFDYITCGIKLKKFTKKIAKRNKKLYKSLKTPEDQYNKYSLKEVAQQIGVNYSYLRKDVVERYGFGYKWLVHTLMVECAARMLVTTDLSITYISGHCGFSDHKYMIKYFRTFYLCTPSEFRLKYRDNYKYDCHYKDFSLTELNFTYDISDIS